MPGAAFLWHAGLSKIQNPNFLGNSVHLTPLSEGEMETQQPREPDLRRTILDVTRHLLVAEGYQSLSMRKIARAIGYSATSIYLYFENKDALFHALVEEGMDRLYGALETAAAGHPESPAARLQAVCRSYIEFGLRNPEYYEIMFLLHPERMARFPVEKYRRARRNLNVIAAVLEEGARGGCFDVGCARVSSSTLWAALHGAVSLLLAGRLDAGIEREAFIEEVIAQATRGLLASGEPLAAPPG